jgi:hypothetical protein
VSPLIADEHGDLGVVIPQTNYWWVAKKGPLSRHIIEVRGRTSAAPASA